MNPADGSFQPTQQPLPLARASLGIAVSLTLVHVACLAWAQQPREAAPIEPGVLQLRLDPNRATIAELELLPRIGPRLARNIVGYRDAASTSPAFACPADLQRVPKIGPLTAEALRPFLRFPRVCDVNPAQR